MIRRNEQCHRAGLSELLSMGRVRRGDPLLAVCQGLKQRLPSHWIVFSGRLIEGNRVLLTLLATLSADSIRIFHMNFFTLPIDHGRPSWILVTLW